ncbi:MAG: response regulator transcription factor [Pseudomonadota bacterium]
MTDQPETPFVLVVDDDKAHCARLQTLLEGQGFRAETANNVALARNVAADNSVDLYLLDLQMPGTSGKVFCKEIADTSRAGVIVISGVDSDDDRIALLEIGADDYIVKPFNETELLARVRAYFRRIGQRIVERVQTFGPWRLDDVGKRMTHEDGSVVTLTPSEAQVMRLFASNPGIVFDREELLAVSRVRQHGGNNDRSIDNLIKRLRRKIEADPANPVYLQTVWGQGYAFRPS